MLKRLSFGLLGCWLLSMCTAQAQDLVIRHTATSENTSGNQTWIPVQNPQALLFLTPSQVEKSAPYAVSYDEKRGQWAIVTLDGSTIFDQTVLHVAVFNQADGFVMEVAANRTNLVDADRWMNLTQSSQAKNPDARFMVTPVFRAGKPSAGAMPVVRFDAQNRIWQIGTQYGEPLDPDSRFFVLIAESHSGNASQSPYIGDMLRVTEAQSYQPDIPLSAKNVKSDPESLPFVTMADDGTHAAFGFVVEYAPEGWRLRNLYGKGFPAGTTFHVWTARSASSNQNVASKPETGRSSPFSVLRQGAQQVLNNPNVRDQVVSRLPNLGGAKENVLNRGGGGNWSFEQGLQNWLASGDAFSGGVQPIQGNTVVTDRVRAEMYYVNGGVGGDYWKGVPYPIGIRGENWIGTYERAGDAPTGTLTSEVFALKNRYVTFLMGGGMDPANLKAELWVRKGDLRALEEDGLGGGKPLGGILGPAKPDDNDWVLLLSAANTRNSEVMSRKVWDLGLIKGGPKLNLSSLKSKGLSAKIVITDQASGGWGHVNVDDVQFLDVLPDYIEVEENGVTYRYDPDFPIWGFGDTHAHMVNNVGMRGFMFGGIGGAWRTSDPRTDIPPCDEHGHGAPTITPTIFMSITEPNALDRLGERLGADPGMWACIGVSAPYLLTQVPAMLLAMLPAAAVNNNSGLSWTIEMLLWSIPFNPALATCGAPLINGLFTHYGNRTPRDRPEIANFVDYPRWNTFNHQQMHITWVRRAYEGGQRLMVIPASPARVWEFIMTANGETTPPAVNIERQIEAIRTMVALNSDWMELALTPQDLRRIVLSNKMAIVMALEQAEIGNLKGDVHTEIDWLWRLGIRHVFPIHNIDNKIGGAAVFNDGLNTYQDFVHRNSQYDPMLFFKVREGKIGEADPVDFRFKTAGFMRAVARVVPILGAGWGAIPFIDLYDRPAYHEFTAHKNALGMTGFGHVYVDSLMNRGMIIDLDHQSDLAQAEMLHQLQARNYPTIIGHANFRDLRLREGEFDPKDKFRVPKMRTEFTVTSSRFDQVVRGGGMFGIMTQTNDVRSWRDRIPNDSPGGSKSFIQAYLYTLEKTGGQTGIAFGTDFNGYAPQIAPRFGVEAAPFLRIEGQDDPNSGLNLLLKNQTLAQRNGVRYDAPINNHHYHRFPPSKGLFDQEERDMWEAIAIWKSGENPETAWQDGGGISLVRTFVQQNKIKNLAKGLAGIQVEPPNHFAGGASDFQSHERYTGDLVRRAAENIRLGRDYQRPRPDDGPEVQRMFSKMLPILVSWERFEYGPNEPLRRSFAYAGGRDFDINLDGHAHYGMFPDMLQDLKNIGLNPMEMRPIFMAAEQYAKLWEGSVRGSRNR